MARRRNFWLEMLVGLLGISLCAVIIPVYFVCWFPFKALRKLGRWTLGEWEKGESKMLVDVPRPPCSVCGVTIGTRDHMSIVDGVYFCVKCRPVGGK